MDFDQVVSRVGDVGGRVSTSPAGGRMLYDFVLRSGARDVLELGFAHGTSTCYLAAALDEAGRGGVVTMDRESARSRVPSIDTLLERTGLADRVTAVFARSSYNWELMRLIDQQRDGHRTRPLFDFAFIDGAHTWETDGLSFFLVDKLLRPGGWILFDDVHWTLASSPAVRDSERVQGMPAEETHTAQVMRVFGLLVMQHPGYGGFTVRGNWAWAQKLPSPGEEPVIGADAVEQLYARQPA